MAVWSKMQIICIQLNPVISKSRGPLKNIRYIPIYPEFDISAR